MTTCPQALKLSLANSDLFTDWEAWLTKRAVHAQPVEVLLDQYGSATGLPRESLECLREEYLGSGPIQPLLVDPDVTEILILNHRPIVYEKFGTWHTLSRGFHSAYSLQNFIHRVYSEGSMLANQVHPFAGGSWCGFRVHIAVEPCAPEGPQLVLRRVRSQRLPLGQLMAEGWCCSEALRLLEGIFSRRENGLVIGATGSGKTTVLNSILASFAETRFVMIEDSPELLLPNPLSSKLLTRFDPHGALPEFTQQDLIHQALRMRPEGLILGEVRGAEAKDLLMAWATGHSPSWSTLHAGSEREAVLRLEMLIQLGAPQWSLSAIRQLMVLALRWIVLVEVSKGQRRLKSISRVHSVESQGLTLERVWFSGS